MISDSPYRTDEPVLTVGEGVLAGAVAALMMLLAIGLLHPLSGLSVRDLLIRIGETVLPRGVPLRSDSFVFVSITLYAIVGALLGSLYAACQDRIPVSGLIAVGVFYGVVIWVVSRVLTAWLLGPTLRSVLHSYVWLLACVLYGMFLAGWAAWTDRHRPKSTAVVPID